MLVRALCGFRPSRHLHRLLSLSPPQQADPRAVYAAWAAHYALPASESDFAAWSAHVLPRAEAADLSTSPLTLNGVAATPRATLLSGLARPHPARLAAAGCPRFAAAAVAAFPFDTTPAATAALPPSVDWAAAGAVGPVKNQHVNNTPCGCCWSFASTGVMEAALGVAAGAAAAKAGKSPPPPPPSLSEQELIDCDRAPPFKDAGCDGGDFAGGIHFAIESGGLTSEASYPYTGKDGRCHRKRSRRGRVPGIDGFKHVPPKSEAALRAAVARGPVAVAVCCGDFIDDWHA